MQLVDEIFLWNIFEGFQDYYFHYLLWVEKKIDEPRILLMYFFFQVSFFVLVLRAIVEVDLCDLEMIVGKESYTVGFQVRESNAHLNELNISLWTERSLSNLVSF